MAALSAPAMTQAYCVGWDRELPNHDPRYYSVSHEFRRAKYVVQVRITRETWLGEDGKEKPLEPPFQNGNPKPWGFDPYMGAYYDLEVLASFKGRPPHRVRIFSENSTARFWFDVGTKHLLFLTEETFDPPVSTALTVDTCGNSTPIKTAGRLLRRLHLLNEKSERGSSNTPPH